MTRNYHCSGSEGKHGGYVGQALLCILILAVNIAGCNWGGAGGERDILDAESAVHPIVLIGLDGLEWDLVIRMLREQELPNLSRLMKGGAFGELKTLHPTLSPIIWTSIATGTLPGKHGIKGFVYTGQDRMTKAFWNILTDVGRRVATIGWWLTFPAEKVNGLMVTQVTTTTRAAMRAGKGIWKGTLVEGLDGQVYPPERAPDILREVGRMDGQFADLTRSIFGEFSSPLAPVPAQLWQHSLWALRADAIYRNVALKVLREEKAFDLLAVYFGGADVVGHRFWRYMQPDLYDDKPVAKERQQLGNIIQDYYGYLDSVVGDLVAAAPSEAVVIVVSDHGMVPLHTERSFANDKPTKRLNSAGHLNSPPGFFVAKGPNIKPGKVEGPLAEIKRYNLPKLGSVLDVTPTMLALLGIPVGRDMDGKVLTGIIDPAFLADNPVRFTDTHTPAGWYEARKKERTRAAVWVERLEQLKALGYME